MSARSRLGVAALVAALVATACSGGARPEPVGVADHADPHAGGTLRVGITTVASLDPALATGASASQDFLADLLFDGLTAYDPATQKVVASIAKSWTVSGDGLTWQFTLRDDARFADGRPVTAADAKASIERVAALGVKSVSGVQLAVVQGYTDFMTTPTPAGLAGLVALDPTVLRIQLHAPLSSLPELLADPAFGIVPAGTQADPTLFASTPVTSGSFMIDSRSADTIVVKRAPGSKAHLDRIEVHQYATDDAAYAAFAAGQLDEAVVPAARTATPAPSGGQVVSATQQVSYFYGMNLASTTLASPDLRHAIVHAVDRDAIRAQLFAGAGQVMTGMIGPGVAGRRADACGAACAYDPAAARALVAQAFPGGAVPTVHLDYYDDPTGREAGVAKLIVEDLHAVGIPAEARAHTFDEYEHVPTNGTAELFRFGWIGSYPSPDAYLASLFGSKEPDNVFSAADATLDTELAAARAEPDDSKRVAHYTAMEDRVFALAMVVPIVQYTVQVVTGPSVHDLALSPNGSFDAARVWMGS